MEAAVTLKLSTVVFTSFCLVAYGTSVQAEVAASLCGGAAKSVPAFVEQTTGTNVQANLGNGLVNIAPGSTLKVGDMVFAGRGSTALVHFADAQCSVEMKPNSVLAIGEQAPCMPAACEAGVSIKPTADAPPADDNLAPIVPFLIGGAALAGIATAVILLTEDDGNNRRGVTP